MSVTIKTIIILYIGILTSVQKCIAQQTLFNLMPNKDTKVNFKNEVKENETLNVLSYEYLYNGGGVAVGDINNDGLEDLFFTSNMGENKLYLNLGNMKFKDITREASGDLKGRKGGWKTGATIADVNGDGLSDIYVCYSGLGDKDQRRNQLFINEGNNKFIEKAKEYGLDDPGYSTQAVFFDYNNDGKLDMFLLNHNVKKISNLEFSKYKNETDTLASNKLFENKGGHFIDVSAKAGIIQNPLTFGLGVAISDINLDGLQDIYVTNDYNEPDYMYMNNGDGSFTEKLQQSLRHISQFSMGVNIGDINNDGLPDIITLDMLPPDNRRQKLLQLQENYEFFALNVQQDLYKQYMCNMLQLNNGDGTFSDIAQLAGMSNTDWSWCPLIADFDNDGFKDLYISNGYLRDYTNKDFLRYWGDYKIKKAIDKEPVLLMDLVQAMPSTPLSDFIFKNNHDLTFSNKKVDWGINKSGLSNGAVYADLDNDGDLDLIINKINAPASIYKNMSRESFNSSYLAVSLKGTAGNINAIGAKVYLYNKGTVQYQEVNPNVGYLSCVSTILNFGLGDQKTVDSLKIVWPDSRSQLLTNITANQRLHINYTPTINPYKITAKKNKPAIFEKVNPLITYKHSENLINDFKRQPLMLFMYSKISPVIAKGDINNDGLEDIFISGDKDTPAKIFVQSPKGKFTALELAGLNNENVSAAIFFDANGDGFEDLYIAKGGYSLLEPNTPDLQDQLYLNNKTRNFVLSPNALPILNESSKSCIRSCDYNKDGYTDLFVGGRIIPGQYPVTPKSYLLTNHKGKFSITATPFSNIGMVSDAQWADINNDGRQDLILCGEFMPIKIYLNKPEGFVDGTNEYFEKPENGFWFSLAIRDVNKDGQPDIIAGNLGLNTQIRASDREPAEMYYADFDNNGSIDPFFNYYIDGVSYPFVSRDELNEQIYSMRKKFASYKAYADVTINQLFSPEELKKAGKLSVNELRTTVFLNKNGKFIKSNLPVEAQFSAVTNILIDDFDHDGNPDLLLLGNHSDNRLKLGSVDANYGCFLKGDGEGNFKYINQPTSGLSVVGDVKSAIEVKIEDKKYLLIGASNESLQFYKEQE